MPLDQVLVDMLRAVHLTCLAAGMGTSLYFDYRTFQTLGHPITQREIDDLEAVHLWITAAFGALWITGTALIYVRTQFDISSFSPKLWLKVGLMCLMVANARAIGAFVLPVLKANLGKPFAAIPLRYALVATQIAVISLFCWGAGLVLGSSVVLKTAPWEVLVPLAVAGFVTLTVLAQGAVMVARHRLAPARVDDPQLSLDLG